MPSSGADSFLLSVPQSVEVFAHCANSPEGDSSHRAAETQEKCEEVNYFLCLSASASQREIIPLWLRLSAARQRCAIRAIRGSIFFSPWRCVRRVLGHGLETRGTGEMQQFSKRGICCMKGFRVRRVRVQRKAGKRGSKADASAICMVCGGVDEGAVIEQAHRRLSGRPRDARGVRAVQMCDGGSDGAARSYTGCAPCTAQKTVAPRRMLRNG
jgi:hypothetical protein